MRRAAARHWAVVELTPLVDVVFLLVIFFLVAADATRLSRPQVALVAGPGEARSGTAWDVVLTLGTDALWRTSVGGSPLVDGVPEGIESGTRVLLRVDRSAPAAVLTSMAEHLRRSGVHRVDLALGEEPR